MTKNQRLDAKMAHIKHQIEALEQKKISGKHEVRGKVNAAPLPIDEEIKFQEWRLVLFRSLKKESVTAINQKLTELGRSKLKSTHEIVIYESMQLAVGKFEGVR